MTAKEQRSHEDQHLSASPITFHDEATVLPGAALLQPIGAADERPRAESAVLVQWRAMHDGLVSQRQPMRFGEPFLARQTPQWAACCVRPTRYAPKELGQKILRWEKKKVARTLVENTLFFIIMLRVEAL